jgi:hypothetical protein
MNWIVIAQYDHIPLGILGVFHHSKTAFVVILKITLPLLLHLKTRLVKKYMT